MIGNFPQTFVHAAFIGSVVDLRAALEDDPSALEREISHAS
jgi:GH15 family glucan-1,4-alpha-glucosidase